MTSRKNTIRSAGRVWTTGPNIEGWEAEITDRIKAVTWQFGSIHQCKVFISYPAGKHPFREDVGICLQAQSTRSAAMKHAIAWAESFIEKGPGTVEQVFSDCFKHYPDLFKTRIDVIELLFFVNGNGYDWLDGAVVPTSPEDHFDFPRYEKPKLDVSAFKAVLKYDLKKELAEKLRKLIEAEEMEEPKERPLPDNGELKTFYPISEYSEIVRVPDDVRPDWLALAYEAATLLRDRSGISYAHRAKYNTKAIEDDEKRNAENIVAGKRIVRELEKRFPHLIKA